MCEFWSITISDIIAIAALIAAVWAAWAATISNKNAKKSLDEAQIQFQENMREQKRGINVSLFDLRMEILASIVNGKFAFDRTRARMLFNNSIGDAIEKYDCAKGEERRYEGLKKEYLQLLREQRSDDTYREATDLLAQIDEYERMDIEDPNYKQIQNSLRKQSITRKWTHGLDPVEYETVNYIDAEESETKYHAEAERIQKELEITVKCFIETSIQ